MSVLDRYEGTTSAGSKDYARARDEAEARWAMEITTNEQIVTVTKLPVTTKTCEFGTVVKINAPDWYARPDFMLWLRGLQEPRPLGPPATWHPPGQAEAGEYSDAFLTVDLGSPPMHYGEGSDSDMPPDIWDELCQVVERAGVQHGLAWLTNLEE